MTSTNIRFEPEDVERFANASHDRNPLHLSAVYARRSAFGEPIIFGILGVLAAVGVGPTLPAKTVGKISIAFRRPLYVGAAYQVRCDERKPDQLKLSIEDGGVVATSAIITLLDGTISEWPRQLSPGSAPTSRALARNPEDLSPGITARGRYASDPEALTELGRRYSLHKKGFSATQVAALLWASYLVGMELPGERAIFSQLGITFHPEAAVRDPHFDYSARVTGFDDRFDLLDVVADLSSQGQRIAEVSISSFVRRDAPSLNLSLLHAALPPSTLLKGKAALVVGGSRGLGAALVGALASQGCDVAFNYRDGAAEAQALCGLLRNESGSVVPLAADAADTSQCLRMRDEIKTRLGGLDIFIANATPPLQGLSFTPEMSDRFRNFVDRSLALVASPLAAFIDLLKHRAGTVVLISSAVASPSAKEYPADWLHYVAAKCAAEGLMSSLSKQMPAVRFLIARPPRMLTDLTNTPQGRHATRPVEDIAAAIVSRSSDIDLPHLSVLEQF